MQMFKLSDTTGTSLEDFTQLIVDLLSFGQTLCKQTQSIGEDLCQEIDFSGRIVEVEAGASAGGDSEAIV